MANIDRMSAEMVAGARVWIIKLGAQIGDTASNTVSETVLPELPESYAVPGNWLTLGKIRTLTPQTDYKTADVEGVDDSGAYKTTEMKLATKRKVNFTTNDIAPEAWQLTFGLKEEITSGGDQPVFASGNDSLEVWLVLEITDAYKATTNLCRAVMRGKLSLTNPLAAKSDPAEAAYQLAVQPNALAHFVEGSLVPSATPAA